jgi:hypothetical protein
MKITWDCDNNVAARSANSIKFRKPFHVIRDMLQHVIYEDKIITIVG